MEDGDSELDTSTQDEDSDSTVLLTEYFDKPDKIDAKRRRLSSLHDKIHADKYEDDEENTASDGASDGSRTNDKLKRKSNVDKNLLITKYLASLGEVKIENNEQQTFSVTTKVTKQIKKVLDSDNGRNSVSNATNTDFDDDIICLDSDDEAQIDDVNEKNQNENQNNAGVHKVYGDNNNLTENYNKYGKLKVLKPAAINARRATINVFERSVLAENSEDSFRLDENKTDTIEVMRSSVIIARRATTSFEENCNTINEINEAIETNAIDNTNMRYKNITVQSYNAAFTSSAISVDTKNLKSNRNKRICNEDKIPSESKRQRTETMTKCTQHLQLKNNTHNNETVSLTTKLTDNPDKKEIDKTIDNKENENLCNTHSEQEKIEAYEVPKESWVGYKSKTLGMVDKQEPTRLQDKEMRRVVQGEEQAIEACDLPGTNKVQDQQEISAILKPEMSTVPNELVTNESHDNVQDNPETNVVPDEQEIYRARDKEVINESQNKPESLELQDKQEVSDKSDEQDIGKVGNDQVINESHQKQNKTEVQGEQETNVVSDEQEVSRARNEEVINKSRNKENNPELQDTQEISVVPGEQEIGIVDKEEVLNESHQKRKKTEIQDVQGMYKARFEEVINKSHDKHKKTKVQSNQEMHIIQDEQEICRLHNKEVVNKLHDKQDKFEVQDKQETNVVSGEHETSRAREEEVINKSHNKEKNPVLQDKQEISVVEDEQSIGKVRNEQVINESHQKQKKTEIQGVPEMCKARYEAHDKHKKTKVQRDQGMRTAQDELEICSVRKEEVINESHDKQKKTELQGKQENTTVQDDHEICKSNNQQEINECHDKQDKYKVQRKQEISSTQHQNVISETRDKQGTSKIPKDQIINEACNNQKRNVVQDDDISRIHDMQGTGDVQDKEVISDVESKADKQVQHLQRTTKAHNQQETKKPNDAQKTSEAINESEKNETNEITRKLCPDREKIQIHNFHVNFFTVVKNFVEKKGYPESAIVLHNLIQTLKTHAMNGIVQTDIKYTCPECKHVTTYSSSFVNNTDPEENIATSDDFQKCRLCQALTKLHISYMKKFLQQVTEGTAQNKVKNNVATSYPPLCNDKSRREADNSNRPTTNKPEIIAKVSKEAGTEMPLCKEMSSQSMNVLNEKDTCVQPIPSHANVETLPDNYLLITKKRVSREYMIDSKRKKLNAEHNDAQHLTECTENTPDKQTNNLKSKSNLIAEAIAEECIEKQNQKTTDHVSGVASEKASSTVINEDMKTYKPGDNKLDGGPSARSENENMETTNSKENDKANEIGIKSLEDTFTRLKHNKNTEQTKNKKAKEQQNTNTVTPVSASNRNNGLDVQPNCNINTRTDVQYICRFCSCKYVRAFKFLRHMRTNHNVKDTTILENCVRRKCAFCNEYLDHKNYNKHVKKYHPEKFTENVATNENNDINEDGSVIMENNMSKTSDSARYKYHCSICEEILCTYYASRQHRKEKHPEFRNQQIYKKVIIKGKNEQDGKRCENEELTAEDNTLNTDSELEDDTDAVTSMKNLDRHCSTNHKKVHQTEGNEARDRNDANNMQQARADESGTTSAKIVGRNENSNINQVSNDDVTIKDTSKYKFHCSVCDEILNNDYASRQHRKQKHPELRRRQIYKKVILNGKEEQDGGDCSSSDESDLDDNEDGASDANNEVNEDSDDSVYVDETCNDNSVLNNTKSVKYSCALCKERFPSYYVARKHRMEKHPNMSGAYLIIKILDDATTSNEQSSNKNAKNQSPSHKSSSSSDNEEIEDKNDKSVPRRYYEKEGNRSDEAIKASDPSIEKRDYNVKLFGNEKETSARAKRNEKISTQESRREQSDDQLRTEHKEIENMNANSVNNFSEIEDAHGSEDGSLKISQRTAKKKKERLSKLFEDDNDDEQPNKTDCDQEITPNNTRNTSNLKPTDDVITTKDVRFSEERENNNEKCGTDTSCCENAKETCINKNDRNCNKVTESNESAINGNNKIKKLNNAETKVQDDDRTEIDMIDCFLEELNSESLEIIHNENSGDNNNKNPAVTASQINDGEIQNNKYQYHTTKSVIVHEETCLDNIKITNVTSIADKLYIYVCQECLYATDDYDIVIRHCQNHYNNIEDPVIYCQICQINYDVPCFQRHESLHDKYLKSIKINFSYEWLFANWQSVFENNEMVLSDAEDMQLKSIYKTFCVKMVVEQDGPWQTSLYLCRKCNTCVPPRDIESHVQQTCQFINENSCSVCNYAFLTADMRIHHEMYHKYDASTLFKIIVFNDTDDESFNLKLFQAKAMVKNERNQRVIDIFKCLCGLCFISLKNLKLHFVECEEFKNNGIDCPECTVLRRFMATELTSHRSLHHGTANYEFKVQQIGFQEETHNNNNSEAVCTPDPEKENDPPAEIEDFVVDELLKDERLTQISNEDESQRHLEPVECIEEHLTDKRDTSKVESLRQKSNGTDDQGYPENVEINEQNLAVKRKMLIDETLTQISNEGSQRQPESVECLEENLTDKRDKSKDKSLRQNSNDNDAQGYPDNVELNEEDLAVKRDMLKYETLTQISNEDDSQRHPESVECIEENLTDKRDKSKDKSLTQNSNDNDAQGYPDNVELNEEDLTVKRDMLKDETLTQISNEDDSQRHPESIECIEENLTDKRDKAKDKSLRQNSNDNDAQGYPDNVELNEEDLAVKRDMLKDETLTQISNEDESQRHPEPVECVEENLTDKRDKSRDESLGQNSNDNDGQGYPENVEINEEDLAVKTEMLKNETLTQTPNKDSEQSDSESGRHIKETDILGDKKLIRPTNKDVEQRNSESVQLDDENLAVESHTLHELLRNTDDGYNQSNTESVEFDEENAAKRDTLKDESLKQANNEGDTELIELSDNEDDVNEKVDSQDIMDVSSETVIPIDSDSDSDIEFVFSNL